MVKFVKKRNGSIEKFDPTKLNQWAEWAANKNVGWSDVLLEAIRSLPETAKSEDIQTALINSCVNRGYSQMAARLLLGQIFKEAYGGFNIPSFKSFYKNAVTMGYWGDFGYSDEELDYIDSFIDHPKDFEYEYCTVRQFYDKYAVSAHGVCLESPQMALMATAVSNTRHEPDRHIRAVAAYKELSKLKINLPTPSLAGQRTPVSGSPSCCVITGGDSVDSIEAAVHVAYKMTAMGSGIGAELSTRSKKDPVKGGTIEHMGKDSYYRYLDRAVKANKQHTRGGSATVTFHVHDPEIDMLLRYKSQRILESQRIDTMDYSLAVTKLFMKKAATDGMWMLVSNFFAPKLYDLSYRTNDEDYEQEYNRVLQDDSIKKTMVKAREILNLFWTQRSDVGRIYRTNLTNINKHTPFKDTIRLSNLCVAPETLVMTDQGYIPIAEISGQEVNIWNGEEWSLVKVVKTGENQSLIKVSTDSGQSLECTPYHKFYIFNGYGMPYKEVRAWQLKPGDRLAKFDLPVIDGDKVLKKAYINGFYSGDGCLTKQGQRIYLYGEKMNLAKHFDGGGKWTIQEEYSRMYKHYADLKDKFFVPTSGYCVESRLDWLAGYLDADGSVYRNGDNEQLVACSVNLTFLQEVQMMLQTLGVSAKIRKVVDEGRRLLPLNDGSGDLGYFECQEAYRLLITSIDTQKLVDMGLRLQRLKVSQRTPQRDARRFVAVSEVVDEGRVDDTYCFTESKRGMGMFNGILTGQCQEIALPTSELKDTESLYKAPLGAEDGEIALCFLASIVAGRVEQDELGNINYDEYLNTAYQAAKFTDNTIDLCSYPFKAMEYTAKNRRSIGIGLTDVAHYMAKNGFKYDTIEGRNALHRLAELHSYALHKASVSLAKERGKCGWFDRTKYSDEKPWLPIDTYEREVDKWHTQELLCDWECLRKEIKEYGVRFSVHEAFMPEL